MARIAKSEHAKIRLLIDVEQRRVSDVAALYGCTPANIHAILTRARREAPAMQPLPPLAEPVSDTAAIAEFKAPPVEDLFSLAPSAVIPTTAASTASEVVQIDRAARGRPVEKGGVGTRLAKPGFGFHMRTADGEESIAPFRSLEDLLSAAKGILRGAARSAEPVWFSIQTLDLSTVDSEAA